MPWAKVKSLNYIPNFQGLENFVTSAILEFGTAVEGVDQTAFATEIDLLKDASFSGTFQPLNDFDQDTALQYVTEVLGVEAIEQLKLKAEVSLLPVSTKFF
jgi:hypothetical protein